MPASSKKKAKASSEGALAESPVTGETRAADALTVAWMLTLFSAIAAEVVALVGWSILIYGGGPEAFPAEIVMMPRVALFIAIVVSATGLLLVPVVHRVRRVPPPRAITGTAIAVGIAPWLLLTALTFF